MSSEKYVNAAVSNIEERLTKINRSLLVRCNTLLSRGYHPEMDAIDELDKDGIQFFQELIGMLRWMVKLGRIDIMTQVLMLSSHLAYPIK